LPNWKEKLQIRQINGVVIQLQSILSPKDVFYYLNGAYCLAQCSHLAPMLV